MKRLCLMFGMILGLWGLSPVLAQETVITPQTEGAPPVVLELFSSQGCSFCPPADALMGQMIQQDGIIGLSCHVDYFGVKKNSLGNGFCTQRQNGYNRLIGTGPRYTPQLVINGHHDVIGYETTKINAAIMKARAEKMGHIEISPDGADGFMVQMPKHENGGGESLQLWLAVFDLPHSLTITEGSNFGKKITYYNVVDRLEDLGSWDGSATTKSLKVVIAKQNSGFAIIAQNPLTGHIVAAGKVQK